MRDIYAVIPAAGYARDETGVPTSVPSSMRRISGKPTIIHIIESLERLGIKKFIIGIEESYQQLFRKFLYSHGLRVEIQFESVDSSKGVMATLRQLMKMVPKESSTLINLGDTLLTIDLGFFEKDFAIYTSKAFTDDRWSRVLFNEFHIAKDFIEKNVAATSELIQAICGIYWFRNSSVLTSRTDELSDDEPISQIYDLELLDVYCYESHDWIDSDHLDVFENGKRMLLESRKFNEVQIDVSKNLVTKLSMNREKLQREISYYQNLPSELKLRFPKMVSSTIEPNVSQTLEFIPWPTLSEIIKYEMLPREVWVDIFSELASIVFKEFGEFETGKNQSIRSEFYDKILIRNKVLIQDVNFDSDLILEDMVLINGVRTRTLNALRNELENFFAKHLSPTTIIHGDFCATNIFVKIENSEVLLIDPRGGFETSTIYGPQIYDIAKLGHSVIGDYDLILADQFFLEKEGNDYRFKVVRDREYETIEDEFWNQFVSDHISRCEVLIATGLILIGIPLFHIDDIERAHAMYLRGLQLLNEGMGDNNENMS